MFLGRLFAAFPLILSACRNKADELVCPSSGGIDCCSMADSMCVETAPVSIPFEGIFHPQAQVPSSNGGFRFKYDTLVSENDVRTSAHGDLPTSEDPLSPKATVYYCSQRYQERPHLEDFLSPKKLNECGKFTNWTMPRGSAPSYIQPFITNQAAKCKSDMSIPSAPFIDLTGITGVAHLISYDHLNPSNSLYQFIYNDAAGASHEFFCFGFEMPSEQDGPQG